MGKFKKVGIDSRIWAILRNFCFIESEDMKNKMYKRIISFVSLSMLWLLIYNNVGLVNLDKKYIETLVAYVDEIGNLVNVYFLFLITIFFSSLFIIISSLKWNASEVILKDYSEIVFATGNAIMGIILGNYIYNSIGFIVDTIRHLVEWYSFPEYRFDGINQLGYLYLFYVFCLINTITYSFLSNMIISILQNKNYHAHSIIFWLFILVLVVALSPLLRFR